jgi:hypothetical protein
MTTKITEKNVSNLANAAVQWQNVITADGSTNTNLEAGKGYFIDTTSNTHTVVLPSNPTVGDTIVIRDYALTFDDNNVSINRNGQKIEGFAADTIAISTEGIATTLTYSGTDRGWLMIHEGNKTNLAGFPLYVTATGGTVQTYNTDYKIHAFTGDGCFSVSCAGNADGSNTVEVLVVAGGGGGGAFYGGGGGAGGLVITPSCGISVSASPGTYPISVGAGGNGTNSNNVAGTVGSNSSGMGFTGVGGGYGAGEFGGGSSGGSGGGGNPVGGGGSATQPSQPNPGGTNYGFAGGPNGGCTLGGGGGGATSVGGGNPESPGNKRRGGQGIDVSPQFGTYTQVTLGDANPTYASNQYYAGGGGGQGCAGGAGGGGTNPISSGAGQDNTGGGARGDSGGTNGGKGIVLIKYKFQN